MNYFYIQLQQCYIPDKGLDSSPFLVELELLRKIATEQKY
ncbi:hypothetical protein J2W97_005532 [Paenibacillus jamilae]|jgi:hypothetical protein|uniref:Uncharacterized protein n=1 Tax=Paenibacillus polymyxa TaxID=1406 RepID=A0A378XZR3_PAEPO|nr:hypothetical protein PPSQR21_024930 [Paenibacillus polymyxa SQR-21]AUS26730.1 hypothetical protein C1A50_2563 [Paenibacillus polymyxa]MDP9679464.1 hypothetical protein [Paenibacillus jamilae]SEJ95536.1 hypothetical protein SAMN04488600_106269 [Paenibacillus polymyxa]SPY20597.1 Uncharacterised protein [Paenibacillus polymyxa]